MRVGRARPRLATMMTPTILRVGAIVAVLSVIGQVTGIVLAPDWNGPPDVGARTVAAADIWKAWLLIQLVGILFVVPAVTVVLMTVEGTDGAGWARLCLPLISVSAALACAQTLIGGSRANLVEAASTESATRAGYLAAFDAMSASHRLHQLRRAPGARHGARRDGDGDPGESRVYPSHRLVVRRRRRVGAGRHPGRSGRQSETSPASWSMRASCLS